MNEESGGKYICKVFSTDGFEMEAEVDVLLKGPPIIKSFNSFIENKTEKAALQCLIFSVPLPHYINWNFEGNPITASTPVLSSSS